jgi:hypothetical protein
VKRHRRRAAGAQIGCREKRGRNVDLDVQFHIPISTIRILARAEFGQERTSRMRDG